MDLFSLTYWLVAAGAIVTYGGALVTFNRVQQHYNKPGIPYLGTTRLRLHLVAVIFIALTPVVNAILLLALISWFFLTILALVTMPEKAPF